MPLSRRQIMLAAAAAAAPAPSSAETASSPSDRLVDPELRPTLPALRSFAAAMPLTRAAVVDARGRFEAPAVDLPEPRPVLRHAPGLAPGAPDVPVYVINAEPGRRRPAVLHIHGGGFVLGSAKANLGECWALALAHHAVVVSVEYRLAPETPFPGPLDDCEAAFLWMRSHADDLGIDLARIAVKGESAGGGLAAMLALRRLGRPGPGLCAQVLLYPMLDDRTGSVRKPRADTPYLWTPEANVFGWTSFLGRSPGRADVAPGAVPARAARLEGLPATFIGVGAIDLFARENIAYADRLVAAGVPTALLVLPGAYHIFEALAPTSRLARALNEGWNAALARAFRT